ncbi:MAG: hypothetical protein ACRELY_25455 [Polyangiaceae bacterium]
MMLLIEKIMLLKTVPMFAESPEEVLAEIAGVMQEVDCKAGQVRGVLHVLGERQRRTSAAET